MDITRSNDLSRPLEELHSNERLKNDSRFLRGTLADSLTDPSTASITPDDALLTKFFGVYQQDDRDVREARRSSRLEPYYMFMVRVRLPGGVCMPTQWLALDAQSRATADGTLRLTTRQTFQFHGVLKHDLPQHIQGIAAAGLDTVAACGDDNRNVISAANPLLSRAHAQAAAAAAQLSRLLLPQTGAYRELLLQQPVQSVQENEEPLYGSTYLPRKFKIAIAVPPWNDVDVHAHDLGLIAIVEHGSIVGYNVLAGGGMGMTHKTPATYPRLGTLAGFCRADDLLAVAQHTMCIQRDFGDRRDRAHARFKYTIEDRGIDWFRDELARRCGKALEPARPFEFSGNGDRHEWHRGDEGLWHYTLFVRNGRIADTPQVRLMSALREIAARHSGVFALTTNQNVTIAGVPSKQRATIDALLRDHGVVAGNGFERHAMACVAFPTCGLAMAESERYLPALLGKLDGIAGRVGLADAPITIRMSGCPNGCSRPFLAEIAFVGKAPGKYNLYLGGSPHGDRLNTLYRENIGEQQILDALEALLGRYAQERLEAEPFGDFVIRIGEVRPMLHGRDFQRSIAGDRQSR